MKFYIFAQVISCVVSVLTQPYLTHLGEIDLLFRTYLDLTEDFFEIDSNFLFALVGWNRESQNQMNVGSFF